MTTFNDLGLAAPLLKALEEEGYQTPTPIQTQAIPSLLAGRDLLGIAQTGTGKTAAFALPILHRLMADRKPAPRRGTRVLVLSPTRELASQIAESFETYGRHLNIRVAVVFGGVGYRPQRDALARRPQAGFTNPLVHSNTVLQAIRTHYSRRHVSTRAQPSQKAQFGRKPEASMPRDIFCQANPINSVH